MADYPFVGFHFEVDWGSKIGRTGFTEVSGLTVETQPLEYRDGLNNEYNVTKFPGMQQYGTLTLKRGVFADDNEFYAWWRETVEFGSMQRRNIEIRLKNGNNDPVVVWTARNAWPIKVDGPSLNATSDDVTVETVELAHEGLSVEVKTTSSQPQ